MIDPYIILYVLIACVVLDLFPWTPPVIKRLVSSWQGLAAGAVALGIYLWLPSYIGMIDPTAGVFDAGVLQWLGLAAVLFFLGIFVAWIGWQIAFRSIDKVADKAISQWWESFSHQHRWLLAQGTFALMLIYWLACLFLIPLK